jgi:hypothetical protein
MLSDVSRDNEVCRPTLPFSPKVKGAPSPGCASDSNKRTENIKPKFFHESPDVAIFPHLLVAVLGQVSDVTLTRHLQVEMQLAIA